MKVVIAYVLTSLSLICLVTMVFSDLMASRKEKVWREEENGESDEELRKP